MFLDLMLKVYIQTQLFFRRKDGASAIEYVIIVSLVAVVIVGFGTGIGDKISAIFLKIQDGIKT
ncbi:Flp family type IVb pilin [Pseudomonas sp. ANT_H14]|uniref:Flp family type IVb pilin n=1 Tax=unclassified Pseudomonas TaxID=196821 RepID=UPI0011EEF069|nr:MULTISPECIES: Flp family type IVb pilin [unclassified Pseudomonas]KAA0942041.1 Flp family type IVb pilin [Pseudomonas sp. ANT_H4]KAA0947533.1 Flp family type IVb pilin [Pseudomonas sp. ANT_H14]